MNTATAQQPQQQTTKGIIKNILEAELREEKEDFAEYLELIEVMKKHVGKKITMRIEKDLPEGFKLIRGFSSFEIESHRKYSDGRNKKHYLCRYEQSNEFTLEHFDRDNAPFSKGAPERIEKLTAILESPEKLNKTINQYENVFNAFNQMVAAVKNMDENDSFHNPAYYTILRGLKVPTELISDIKYDKFKK